MLLIPPVFSIKDFKVIEMRIKFLPAMDKGKNSSHIFEESESVGAIAKSEEI